MRNEQGGHPRLTQPQAHPITRHARLGDLKKSLADAVAVTDADLLVAHPVHGEVLAEVSRFEVVAPEFSCPVTVGINLVHQHRALFATVSGEIALPVPVNVESSNHPRPCYRRLPYTGEDRSAAPFHIARKTDIHRGHGRQSPHLARCAALLWVLLPWSVKHPIAAAREDISTIADIYERPTRSVTGRADQAAALTRAGGDTVYRSILNRATPYPTEGI